MNVNPEKQKWCAQGQHLMPVSGFDLDRYGSKGYANSCKECLSTGHVYSSADVPRVECTRCHQVKTTDSFYKDNSMTEKAKKERYGRGYWCKACFRENSGTTKRRPALLASGLRVHVGNGVITQEKEPAPELVKVPEVTRGVSALTGLPVPVETPFIYADMTVNEWLLMDQVPSIFVTDKYALLLSRTETDRYVHILSVSGDGPGKPVDSGLASYIVRILLKEEPDAIRGAMFY